MERMQKIQSLFDNIRTETDWDVNGALRWGYFFADTNPENFKPIGDYLASIGYNVVDVYPSDDNTTFFLHVESIEPHTPETLNLREEQLRQLAAEYGVEAYDGTDVSPVDA